MATDEQLMPGRMEADSPSAPALEEEEDSSDKPGFEREASHKDVLAAEVDLSLTPPGSVVTSLQRKLKSVEDLLICPICLENYSEPKSLVCLHALCRNCITCMIDAEKARTSRPASGDIMITCPTCRQRSSIPGSDPRNLPDNFIVKNMIEALNERSPEEDAQLFQTLSLLDSSASLSFHSNFVQSDRRQKLHRSVDCGNCGDEKDVFEVCLDCKTRLCKLCAAVHRKQLASRSHTVAALESLEERDQRSFRFRAPHCDRHACEPQEFFCNTCQKMICRECALFDHRRHEYITVEQHAEGKQPLMATCVSKLESLACNLPERIEHVQRCSQTLQQDSVNIREQASQHIEKHIDALKERKHSLLREALRQHEGRMLGYQQEERSLLDQQACARDLLAAMEEANVVSSPWDQLMLTDQFQQCVASIEKLLCLCPIPDDAGNDPTARELMFDDSMASDLALRWESGAIVGKGSGMSRTDAARYILDAPDVSHTLWTTTLHVVDTKPTNCGASLTAHGQSDSLFTAVLAMEGCDERAIPVTDLHNGTHIIQLNLATPGWAKVSVYCRGKEIRASPAMINVLQRGRTLKMFGSRGTGECQFRDPYDIAIADFNNHLFVADTGNHRVLELTENGVFVNAYKYTGLDGRAMKPTAIIVTQDGKLIVADYNHKCLLVFDSETPVKVVQPPDSQERRNRGRDASSRITRPLECYGLAVDSLGQILATDYVERSVLVFSAEVEYQSAITCSCQLPAGVESESLQSVNPRGPLGIHVGSEGDQYFVADFGFSRLTVLEATGEVARQLGSRLKQDSEPKDDATEDVLKRPWGIWFEPKTNDILVSDHTSNSLMIFSSTGRLSGRLPLADDTAPRLFGPVGMAADKFGRVWVCEREAHRVRLL